jgi:hypothetical protein
LKETRARLLNFFGSAIRHLSDGAFERVRVKVAIFIIWRDRVRLFQLLFKFKRFWPRQPAQALPDPREARLALLRPPRRQTHLDTYAYE